MGVNHLVFIPDAKTGTVSSGRKVCALFTVWEHLAVNPFLLVPNTELTFIFILQFSKPSVYGL